jgi:hypothetical protein
VAQERSPTEGAYLPDLFGGAFELATPRAEGVALRAWGMAGYRLVIWHQQVQVAAFAAKGVLIFGVGRRGNESHRPPTIRAFWVVRH